MLRPLWSLKWTATIRGLVLARESQHLLVWDDHQWLTLLNHKGERQAQHHRASRIISASISEDGGTILMADADLNIVALGRDLQPLWQRRVSQKPHAVTLDCLGHHAAVSDAGSRLRMLNSSGHVVRDFSLPRAAYHLRLVPLTGLLALAADFGLVGNFDLSQADFRWRESPVVHHGGICVTGAGDITMVACFSDGLRLYDNKGKPIPFTAKIPACRMVDCAFDARLIVTMGTEPVLHGTNTNGKMRFEHRSESAFTAMSVDGLGERLYTANAVPELSGWAIPP